MPYRRMQHRRYDLSRGDRRKFSKQIYIHQIVFDEIFLQSNNYINGVADSNLFKKYSLRLQKIRNIE